MHSYCFNLACKEPENCIDDNFCRTCGSSLLSNQKYRAVGILGHGGFSRTYLAEEIVDGLQNNYCVVKQMWGENYDLDSHLHKNLPQTLGSHPQLPNLLAKYNENGCRYLVHEYIKGENLAISLETYGNFKASQVLNLLTELLRVLNFIHNHKIIHGDIKPINIVKQKSEEREKLYLVGFGANGYVTENNTISIKGVEGSAEFAAPEQLKGETVFASDLYSLGVTCINLLTGISPFDLFGVRYWQQYWLRNDDDTIPVRSQNLMVQILDRMIEPNLAKRYQSTERVLQDIYRLGIANGLKRSPTLPPRSNWFCSHTLKGHHGLFAGINAVAILPGDRSLASASDDRTIRIWDIQTGEEKACLSGHNHFVKSIACGLSDCCAPSGVIASADRTIKLWDVSTYDEIYTFEGHSHTINSLAFSKNKQLLASGSADKTIKLWQLSTKKLLITFKAHLLSVNAIAFNPDISLLASASSDRTIKLWDLNNFHSHRTLSGHTWAVRAIAFSPDGLLLASGGDDNTIYIWSSKTGEIIHSISGHSWKVSSLAFTPDGKTLISGSWDKTLKLWSTETGKELEVPLKGHTDSVTCLAVCADGKTIVSGSEDKTLKIWQYR